VFFIIFFINQRKYFLPLSSFHIPLQDIPLKDFIWEDVLGKYPPCISGIKILNNKFQKGQNLNIKKLIYL